MNAYKQYVFSSTTAGGARLAAALARLALIDEYRLLAHPVVSPGAAWFDQIEDQHGMQLISARRTERRRRAVLQAERPTDPTPPAMREARMSDPAAPMPVFT